jgi:hypothetical protein
MTGDPWGPKAPRSAPIKHSPGAAVGEASLGGAVGHLHKEHPHHVQGEGLQHDSNTAIHHPVSSSVYKGK